MKKIYKRIFQILLTLLFANFSVNAQNADLITKHKWITASSVAATPIDLNKKSKASTDLMIQSPPCTWDDVFIFKEKNILIVNDNKDVCVQRPVEPGSWMILNDSLTINFSTQYSVKFKILELDNSKMVLLAKMPFIPGGVNVTTSFKVAD